jgi:hypothetical protein
MNDGKHQAAALNFGGFTGYYGLMSAHNGYGGFNYVGAFNYMNASMWTNPNGYGYQNDWCDTGYQNMSADAKSSSLGWIYEYGLMESASRHSFSLESLLATASFSDNQKWEIISYTEKHGSLVEKASMYVTLSYDKISDIKFTGKNAKGFSNIAAVAFQMASYGSPGNSCTYSTAVYGLQMAFDKVKVKFSTTADLKQNAGDLLTPYQLNHAVAAGHSAVAPHNFTAVHADAADHHSHLHSPEPASLFGLPAIEHLLP